MIALYGSIISLISLLFEYINYAFPDPLAGWADPYSGAVRTAMAALIVLVPTTLGLLHIIRTDISREPAKERLWVRRWALMLTLFIAGASIVIDLITLVNTFLGGEMTVRFGLKVAAVLLVASAVFMHFLADLKGYWLNHLAKARMVAAAVAVLAIAAVVSGFFIVGTPGQIRLVRFDMQKVEDLRTIQYQVVNYWQSKQALPVTLEDLNDPLSYSVVPTDPQPGYSYRYEVAGETSFKLCAYFNEETKDLRGRGEVAMRDMAMSSYPGYPGGPMDENWQHGEGETCFTRTIDPDRFPPFEKPLR